MAIEMLKKRAELQKEALKDELDSYKDLIDAKKKLLDLEDEEYNHQKDLAEKTKAVSDIQKQLAEIQYDTSANGIRKRKKLEEDLSKAQSDLDDFNHDYSIDQQKNALDEEYDRYEAYINKKIKALENYLDQTGKIEAEAIALMNQHSQEFLNQLLEYNRTYGDSLDSTVLDKWDTAKVYVNAYTEALNSAASAAQNLNNVQSGGSNVPVAPTASSTSATTYTIFSASGAVAARNVSRASVQTLLNAVGSGSYFKNNKTGKKNVYHSGLDAGFVGDVKGNEQFVKALKGEAFITREQQDKFMNTVLPKMTTNAALSSGSQIGNLLNIEVQGNLDSSVVPKIEEIAKDVLSRVNKTLLQNGYKRNASSFSI